MRSKYARFNPFSRLLSQRKSSKRAHRHTPSRGWCPKLEPLENRRLLAFSASYSAGALSVTSTDNVNITIDSVFESSQWRVKVNGNDPTGGPVAASSITSISVSDSNQAHTIDLSGVTTARFTSLTGTTIDGNSGSDTIYGSEVADVIHGNAGNDTIYGGAGNDTIYGDGDVNFLHGEAGNDTMYGGSSLDAIYAGDGSDTVDGGGNLNVLVIVGTTGADEFASDDGDTVVLNSVATNFTNITEMTFRGGDGDDLATVNECDFAGSIVSVQLWGEAGEDTLIVTGDEGAGPHAGLEGVTLEGGTENDVLEVHNFARTAASNYLIYGAEGDDTLTIHESAVDSLTTFYFEGNDGTDTLALWDVVSGNATVYGDRIELSDNETISFIETESLQVASLDHANTIEVVTTEGALPDVTIVGDRTDLLILKSEPGGYIQASAADYFTTFDVDGTLVQTALIATFELDAHDVSFDGYYVEQRYTITTDYLDEFDEVVRGGTITFSGDLLDPAFAGGYDLDPSQKLIENVSHATLIGGFDNGNIVKTGPEEHYEFDEVEYVVQYIDDVLLQSESFAGSAQVKTTHVTTHHDDIPRFVSAWADSESLDINWNLTSGDWDDLGIWSLGHVPTAGELVRITSGTTVDYDIVNDTDAIRAIEVAGALIFATDTDTHLLVGTIEVLPGGLLEVGSLSTPVDSTEHATITFADELADIGGIDADQYGTGLIGFGDVSIHGSPIGELDEGSSQTWIRLSAEIHENDEWIYLSSAAPAGWDVGDYLVLPDTRQATSTQDHLFRLGGGIEGSVLAPHSETVQIAEFNVGRTAIRLVSAAQFDHLGGHSWDEGESEDILEILPHVALLTRNVTLTSEDPDGYRGHTMYGGRADVDIEYAHFLNLGRTDAFVDLDDPIEIASHSTSVDNHIGRYPVHFHHLRGPINVGNTGYQYKFIGNTVEDGKKWAVAIHDTSYGFLADNVIYKAQGSGFITEDGSEIENLFRNNITIEMHGTFEDGFQGLAESGIQSDNDHARGGVGFWFRRSGNHMIGNVSADNYYGGVVITSYYMYGEVNLPDFRGADTHSEDESTPSELNPAGTIRGNEIYGLGQHSMWLAYMAGHNLLPNQPHIVIEDQTIWNGGLRSFIEIYHESNVTFDNLYILGDIHALTRTEEGVRGIDMALYESIDVEFIDSHIENMFIGIRHTPNSGIFDGEAPHYTLVDNTGFRNFINIEVFPGVEQRAGKGNAIKIVDSNFDLIENPPNDTNYYPANDPDPVSANIYMNTVGNSEPLALWKYVLVEVENFNDDPDDDFQVFFNEQHEDAYMEASDLAWNVYLTEAQIGAPAGGPRETNIAMQTNRGYAMGGQAAPATGLTTRAGVVGLLLEDDVVNPITDSNDPVVVIVTPWDGASFVAKDDANASIVLRYLVTGLMSPGEEVRFELTPDGGSPIVLTNVTNPLIDELAPGLYHLRGYIWNSGEVAYSSFGTVDFTILPEQILEDVQLPSYPADGDLPLKFRTTKSVTVSFLLVGVGGESLMNQGIAITGETSVQGKWQYVTGGVWTDLPSVSTTAALVLPKSAQLRFVVDTTYEYDNMDPAASLTFQVWDTGGGAWSYTQVDITDPGNDDYFDSTEVTLLQDFVAA